MEITITFKIAPAEVDRDYDRRGTLHQFAVAMNTGPTLAYLNEPIFVEDREAHSPEHRARLALERAKAKVTQAIEEDLRNIMLQMKRAVHNTDE